MHFVSRTLPNSRDCTGELFQLRVLRVCFVKIVTQNAWVTRREAGWLYVVGGLGPGGQIMEWVKIEGKRCEARLKIEHVRAFRYRIRSKGC